MNHQKGFKFKAVLGLYFLGFLAVALASAIPAIAWLSPLAFMIILPAGALWIWKRNPGSFGNLGTRFSSGWLRYLVIGLIIGLAIPILFQGLELLGGWITLGPREIPINTLLIALPLTLLRMLIVVAIEEIMFRGFFLQELGQRTGVWTAIVLSSLLWGAGHLTSMVSNKLPAGLIVIGMATFLFWGITQSLGFFRAGKSLWLPYGLHLGINLSFSFSLLGWFYSIQPAGPQWWIGHPAWMPESGFLGVIVWLGLAGVIYMLTGHKRITIGNNLPGKGALVNEMGWGEVAGRKI
jgi:uncharacterized protein